MQRNAIAFKQSFTVIIVSLIIGSGIAFQYCYDQYEYARKERIRKLFVEVEKRPAEEGWVTNIFFLTRKARTPEQVDHIIYQALQDLVP